MKNIFLQFRYYLEIIALPAFIFLVIHLAGHGMMAFVEEGHHHGHHEVEHHEEMHHEAGQEEEVPHEEEHQELFDLHELIESFFTVEVLSGILLLLLFVWIWHRPAFKKWVPCQHEHCHHKLKIPHLLAIFALCLHFFPEAGVRHVLLEKVFATGSVENILGFVGFVAHFFVDVIIALVISLYWKTRCGFFLSFVGIAVVWILAFWVGGHVAENISHEAEGILFLVSAFLLAMFVHKPHKPVTECQDCSLY